MMQSWPISTLRVVYSVCLIGMLAVCPEQGQAQLQFTEVMHSPGGDDNLWEWVEVRNTSSAAVNLDGWVFDDDDDATISATAGANIQTINGNTMIPAGGVGVLYAGSNLDYMPERFTDAWGNGVNLIPVAGFTSLTATDFIGLWPSYAAYAADDLGVATSPRRSFAHAAVSLNYAAGFPSVASGHSIAWNGNGNVIDGANWVESQVGVLQAVASSQTTIESTPINGADRGNPGVVPGGAALAGLRITEIMYDPASPEPDWEWVEIVNNTASAINFSTQNYVLHDDDGADFSAPNIVSGSLAQGGIGVLFNASANTLENMQAAWDSGINFIPVTTWGNGFSNSGDTVAIWSSIEDYNLDAPGTGRSTAHAAAVVAYDDTNPWPANNDTASIFVNALDSDPSIGSNWVRSGTAADELGSSTANPVLGTVVDHPGGDVGSPGYAPGSETSLFGDYNGNLVVDAADYTVWRDHLGGSSLLNDASPGTVDIADYNYWKAHFGATASGGGGIANVPAPTNLVLWLTVALVGSLRRRNT